MRFRMLETLREYGQEQLSPEDWADLERRHAAYYLALAERAKPELMGPQQVTWFARLEAELDNFRAVTDWSMEAREPEIGLGLAGALWWFLDIQCYLTEWRERLERLLAMPEVAAPTAMRAGGLSGAAGLAFDQGDYAAARAYREEALPIYIRSGDRWRIALSYFHLGRVVGTQGDYAAARALYEESMAVCRSLGASDPGGRALIANSLYCLAVEARQQGEYERARALCEEALEIRRAVGSRRGLAITLNELGRMRCHQGEYGAARALIEESLAMGRETGDQRVIAGASNNLGRVLLGLGEHAAARAVLTESLAAHRGLYRETWHRRGFAECLEGWALLAAAGNRPERAARLFGAANSLREGQGVPLLPADRAEFEPSMAALQAALGQAVFTAAWEAGYALTWEQAVHEALQGEDDTQNC
jgi:tetratricopeptide (TPR) repeat protein